MRKEVTLFTSEEEEEAGRRRQGDRERGIERQWVIL